MFTKKQRIAFARVVSDMIKADNIIEESEIDMLNRFKSEYDLDSHILSEAHRLKFSSAVSELLSLSNSDKIQFFNLINQMALADGVCVPKEAMLLLAIRYAFGIRKDNDNKYYIDNNHPKVKLLSCPTGESSVTSQYVIYIEGEYSEEANNKINKDLENNVLRLREWGFDFVYIPALVKEFMSMNQSYVKDVIRYMAPTLTDETINYVYDRLSRMDTSAFCNNVLADTLEVKEVKNSAPSLFINIGTSVVPYCTASGPIECYTEFLCIPLGENISEQIRDFISAYSKIVSFYATPKPVYAVKERKNFKYFGFYKAMFDFLVKAEPKTSDIILYKHNNLIEFPQVSIPDLKFTPQQAAIYKLILECTYNREYEGLPNSYTKYEKEIEQLYRRIYQDNHAELPYDNLASIRSRIEKSMKNHLVGLANLDDYIPKNVDGKYIITARPEQIKIRDSHTEQPKSFVGHKW